MSTLPPRNRVIYQSEALFISPDATGKHIYYMPPKSVSSITGATTRNPDYNNQCMVSGSGAGGALIEFDTCMGTGGIGGQVDFKYRGFACTGKGNGGTAVTSAVPHAVLLDAGMLSGVSGSALAKLANVNQADGGEWGTAVEQLKRVQNANYSFTINRQDINQFGHLGRLDAVVLEAPTVSLDFSYYLTDGENERLLGFVTNGQFQNLSGHMTREQNNYGNNYMILTVPEGRDALKGDIQVPENQKTVISLGNGYVTDYSVEASVGAFPTASVTVEGMNIKSDIGTDFTTIPAIDPQDGSQICEKCFSLPPVDSGYGVSVLKPGDITIDLSDAGLISKQISGRTLGYGAEDAGSAHIQSFTLSTPMGRTALQRLGNTYSFAKEVDFPVTATLSVNALVADLKSGNLVDLVCGGTYEMQVRIQNPQCVTCDPNSAADGMVIDFKRAVLDSESFSSAIGDNKTVDLTFSTQIGGPEEVGVGVFVSGYENDTGADGLFKSSPDWKTGYYRRYGKIGSTGGSSARGSWSTELYDHTAKP